MLKLYEEGKLLLSSNYLKAILGESTVNRWAERDKPYTKKNNSRYFNYDDIPSPSRNKLSSKSDLIAECRASKSDECISDFLLQMKHQKEKGFVKFRCYYKDKYSLPADVLLETSQLHTVWVYIIEQQNRSNAFELYEAFNKVFPDKYNYNSFCNAKSKATKEGAESVSLDKRLFSAPNNVKRISPLQEMWVRFTIASGKQHSNRVVFEKVKDMCKEANVKPPSKSWVDKYRSDILKTNINIFQLRYGHDRTFASKLPYASMQHATYANQQWQMDGWTLPLWTIDNEGKGYHRLVIVIVRDAYSKKIVGNAVGDSEGTLLIRAALNDAIEKSGCLPLEILTDNHSFNKTKEAAYFKEQIAFIGTQFTVTSNPQYKSIVERYNKHLDTLCKDYFGYTGENITSRNRDGRPAQELLDNYSKNFLQKEEIILIGKEIVDTFNNGILTKYGKSPNQLYDQSDKSDNLVLSIEERVKVCTPQTEYKITRGQINIIREGKTYEFQLSAELFNQYNDKLVSVRYEDLKAEIYIYDKTTDAYISTIPIKSKIHGAKANQNENDIQLLQKNKGRLKGIQTQAKKDNEQLLNEALNIYPEAVDLLNKKNTPKDVLKEAEQRKQLKREIENTGINLSLVNIPERKSEINTSALLPEKKSKNPFQVSPDHKCGIFNPSKY